MRRIPTILTALFLGSALVLAGCDSTGSNGEQGDDLRLTRVEDLAADPPTSSGGGQPTGTGQYTFFSLRDSSVVLRYDESSRADSASTTWDLAFQSTNVLVNGGTSGPGEGAAYVAEQPFQDVTEVNTDAFETDDAGAGTYAIPQGSGNGWYNYNRNTNVVSPLPGRTVVVRTAGGEAYAKIRFVSYYKGAPDDPTAGEDESRYYTFEYVIQANGTSFE